MAEISSIRLLRPQKPALVLSTIPDTIEAAPGECYATRYDTLLVPLEREIFFTSILPT
jgi:hypothetical protein